METTERPKGKTTRELLALARLMQIRQDAMIEAWGELTDDEQDEVLAFALAIPDRTGLEA